MFSDGFLKQVDQMLTFAKTDTEALCMAAVKIAGEQGTVTADDVRAATRIDRDKRILGIALGYLKKRNVLYVVGYQATATETSNSRPVFIFALTPAWKSFWPEKFMMPEGVAEGPALVDAREREHDDMKAKFREAAAMTVVQNEAMNVVQRQVVELTANITGVQDSNANLRTALESMIKAAKTTVISNRWTNMKLIRDAEAALAGVQFPR